MATSRRQKTSRAVAQEIAQHLRFHSDTSSNADEFYDSVASSITAGASVSARTIIVNAAQTRTDNPVDYCKMFILRSGALLSNVYGFDDVSLQILNDW